MIYLGDPLAWSLVWLPDHRSFVTAQSNGVFLWDAESRSVSATLAADHSPWLTAAIAPQAGILAAGNNLGQIRLWRCADLERGSFAQLQGEGPCMRLAISPDGHWLLVTNHTQIHPIQLFDTRSGSMVLKMPVNKLVGQATISPDGRAFAAIVGRRLLVQPIPTGEPRYLDPPDLGVLDIVSYDGQTVVQAGGGRMIRILDWATGRPRLTLTAHRDELRHGAMTPDGRYLATASLDGTVKLWHVETGRELGALYQHPDGFARVAFSHDGARLAAVTGTLNRIFLFDGKPPAP
jgi:WD40 repeat protein